MDQKSPRDVDPEPVLVEIARRFRALPAPDRQIRPADLRADELRRFGLPPQPFPSASPVLHRVWDRAFGQDLELVPFSLAASLQLIREAPHPITARRIRAFSAPTSPIDTSGNWAGAYLGANRDRRFTQIWGVWTVPEKLDFPPPPRTGVPGLSFLCSNWIGLDGQRRYLDSSLPQVGTVSQLDPDGKVTARSWVQWWARDASQNAPTYLALPVSPGDEVLAVLTAIDPQHVEAVFVNLRSPVPVGMAVAFTSPTLEIDGEPVMPRITGATAEWIVERPSVPGHDQIFNFPDYGTSGFEMCVAVECDAIDLQSLPSGTPQLLHGSRLIRMLEIEADAPTRVAMLSLAKRLGPSSLRVEYGGFRI